MWFFAIHCFLLALYPPVQLEFEKLNVGKYPLNTSSVLFSNDSAQILPIVVHVVHSGTEIGAVDNPSDSMILAMISLLNDAFSKNGPFFGGANIDVSFQLASRGQDCNSTNAINRVDGSALPGYVEEGITNDTFNFPESVHEVFVKSLSRWPNTDYVNIWIVSKINGDSLVPGGYAYFPQYNSALTDGIVLQANVVNGSNKTIVHEFGHYFSLYHPYDDVVDSTSCDMELECVLDGDLICDTEPCEFEWNCAETLNACTGETWEISDSVFGYTILNNYMGFTSCQWMFTEGQKERMHNALESFRPGLLTSGALLDPSVAMPADACVPSAGNALSPYFGIERVEVGSLNVYSNTSEADGAHYIDRTCNQQVEVEAGDHVFIRITGSYTNWHIIKVYLDVNNNGSFDLPGELLLDTTGDVVEDTITIPEEGNLLCQPLRLRVVAENPQASDPSACALFGTPEEGVGQAEDYSLIIRPRQVISLSSGDWDDPGIWSCACVPGMDDFVLIEESHEVFVTPEMGFLECAGLSLDTGALIQIDGNLRVKGTCNVF